MRKRRRDIIIDEKITDFQPLSTWKRWALVLATGILFGLMALGFIWLNPRPPMFDGLRALNDVEKQLSFGPRTPGSPGHQEQVQWMMDRLKDSGWKVELQETSRLGHPIRNIIASKGSGEKLILLGAHYDTRFVADHDPVVANQTKPVPGANDGASGVAVLLELARVIPQNPSYEIKLLFFDAEDQGNIAGWDWILGSRAYAETMVEAPDAVVIVDMIGDADLNIYKEKNSDPALIEEIWGIANELGFEQKFIPEYKFSMLDDHTPFLEKGYPAVDLIDFDYPYWHTIQDTADKVSAESLYTVGRTLQVWLSRQ